MFWQLPPLNFHPLFLCVAILLAFPLLLFLHVLLPIAVCLRPVPIRQTPRMVNVV